MRRILVAGLAVMTAALVGCESSTQVGQGTLEVRLTDAPFPVDSVQSVNIYVVRVDVRIEDADEADAEDLEGEDDEGAWVTVAEPNGLFNLVDLQDGVTVLLGTAPVDVGTFRAVRLVIDETQSSIVLVNGTELTGDASPFVKFPSGAQSGIKVQLAEPLEIVAGQTVVTVLDFSLEDSFVMRGSEMRNGLLFKPVVRASTGS